MKIGVMSFAHTHAVGYTTLLKGMGVEVLTCDPDRDSSVEGEVRGAEMAAQLGVDHVDTYEELFAWGPDAVVICSENTRHRRDTELAASHGVHVLCEKPLATTVADAEAMIEACEQAGVLLMTAFPVHFSPQAAQAKAAVESGQVGELMAALGTNNGYCPVGVRAWFLDPQWSGGGCLVDHTVHVAELLHHITGARPVVVNAVKNQIMHAELPGVMAETGGLVTITYDNGFKASIDCSWSVPQHAPTWGGLTLELVGRTGVVEVDAFATRVGGWDSRHNGRDFWLPFGTDMDAELLRTFVGAVEGRLAGGNDPAPAPDGNVGLLTTAIVQAARESAETGQPVEVSLPG
ncbi:Gfo/Idh/MocA family protein [Aestuariimicrobium ganziense]|uniref:Gfo/Idh/MocA family protein n=1 Tax=Aestuariimicrobium ganziense TaxID=2773677 RepID=UPI0019452025|nr:Gfo/Idh/MocA family oxidoreductase [Aestuariimicrobium ganziense]